jgi:hypothetical protein
VEEGAVGAVVWFRGRRTALCSCDPRPQDGLPPGVGAP